MTKSHCFCAICGAPTGRLEWDASSADTYSPHLVNPRTVEWLTDVALLVFNQKEKTASMYLNYEHQDARRFRLVQHTKIPTQNAIRKHVSDVETYEAFHPSNGQPVVIALHTACHEVWSQVVFLGVVEPTPLYKALEPHCTAQHEFVRALDYDYGSVTSLHQGKVSKIPIGHLQNGGFWKIKNGSESAVSSPNNTEEIGKLIDQAVEIACQQPKPEDSSHWGSKFWRSEFSNDLPWAVKFLPSDVKREELQINWEVLYKTLKQLERGEVENQNPAISALQNRARIWGLCSRILKEYNMHLEADADERDPQKHSVMVQNGTKPDGSPLELYVKNPASKWEYANLAYYNSLTEAEPCIKLYWSDGPRARKFALASLGVAISQSKEEKVMGSDHLTRSLDFYEHSRDSFRTESFKIPKGSWLSEVVVYTTNTNMLDEWYSQTEIKGIKFVLTNGQSAELGQCHHPHQPEVYKAPPGHFIVGVSVDYELPKLVRRLEFYCQPISKAPLESHARFVERRDNPSRIIPGPQQFNNPLKLHNDRVSGRIAMSHSPFIFGEHQYDPTSIVSFGVDVHLGGFSLTLERIQQRKTVFMGPRRAAMKYLTFEGETDEDDYIIGCWVHKHNDIPIGLRFFTRKGRQLIAGEPGGEAHLVGNISERGAPVESFISGISATWSSTEFDNPRMTSFEAFTAGGLPDSCVVESLVPTNRLDLNLPPGPEDNVYLDSTVSPMCIPHLTSGWGPQTVYGRERSSDEPFHRNGRKRSDRSIVSYVDLSGPIRTIKGTFCHPQKSKQLPLVGMTVERQKRPKEYRDRHGVLQHKESSFGLDVSDTHVLECDCRDLPEPSAACHHYFEKVSKVDGKQIRSIRIWLTADNVLAGLAFTMEGSMKGPLWFSTNLRDKSIKLFQMNRLPGRDAMEPGIVLFLDSNESPSAHDDFVVVGVRPVGFGVPKDHLH